MASDSARIRASDEDRDRVAGLLQEHHAEGRLTAEEFSERMDAALHARTLGELDELMADLPHVDRRHYQLPDAGINPRRDRLYPASGTRPAGVVSTNSVPTAVSASWAEAATGEAIASAVANPIPRASGTARHSIIVRCP